MRAAVDICNYTRVICAHTAGADRRHTVRDAKTPPVPLAGFLSVRSRDLGLSYGPSVRRRLATGKDFLKVIAPMLAGNVTALEAVTRVGATTAANGATPAG